MYNAYNCEIKPQEYQLCANFFLLLIHSRFCLTRLTPESCGWMQQNSFSVPELIPYPAAAGASGSPEQQSPCGDSVIQGDGHRDLSGAAWNPCLPHEHFRVMTLAGLTQAMKTGSEVAPTASALRPLIRTHHWGRQRGGAERPSGVFGRRREPTVGRAREPPPPSPGVRVTCLRRMRTLLNESNREWPRDVRSF